MHCAMDTVPARLRQQVVESIGLALLDLMSGSFTTGCVPGHFKLTVMQPQLKKNLDASQPSSYRPISKPPFSSELLEKAVAKQLLDVLKRK